MLNLDDGCPETLTGNSGYHWLRENNFAFHRGTKQIVFLNLNFNPRNFFPRIPPSMGLLT
jgi:hypothetical protein